MPKAARFCRKSANLTSFAVMSSVLIQFSFF